MSLSCFARGLRLAASLSRPSHAHRSFSASKSLAFARPTPPLLYSPRWVNAKNNKKKDSEQNEENESEDDHETDHGDEHKSSPSSSASPAPPESSSASPPPSAPPPPPSAPPSGSIARNSVPEVYPQVLALPIARRPLFPGFYKAVVVRNPAVVAAIKDMMKRGQPYLGAFLLKDENTDADVITDINQVHQVGVFAQITSVFTAASPRDADGVPGEKHEEGLTAVLYPHRRIKITELVQSGAPSTMSHVETEPESTIPDPAAQLPTPPASPPLEGRKQAAEQATPGESDEINSRVIISSVFITGPLQTSFLYNHNVSVVSVDNLHTQPYNKDDQYVRAFMSEIVSVFKDIAQLNPLFRDQITNFSISQIASNVFDEPDKLADFAAAVSSGEVQELQDVLESLVVDDRLRKALLVIKKELINAQLQSKLSRDVDSKIAKRQREYYLMEQLKGIKKELGVESDGKDKLIEKLKERAAALKMPEAVRKVFDEEIAKLASLEPAASEANVTRNYLDWLTQIPWGRHSPENFNIKHARQVLDADHYGLEDVKSRILEFLAVGKLRGTVQGKIICFVGPPGVGKTSIGKSIARALGRQFFRFSVGGLTDVAEIKGHRRTYVGALPGKIIQALKRVGTENPLVLIDEVDKIGRGINGDPASALLEMLDPEQNNNFLDH